MNAHYVYLLKSKNDGRLYIGDRTAPNGNPYEDIEYKSSSKCVSIEYLQNCKKRILKTFPTRKEAKAYEIYLHNKYDVANNIKFFNEAKQTSTGFCTYGKTYTFTQEHKNNIGKTKLGNTNMLGKTHTKETKEKIAAFKRGIPRTEEVKKKVSQSNKALYKNGYVNPMTGNKHSCNTKSKIAKKRMKPWFIQKPNGEIEKFYDITTHEKAIKDGFSKTYYSALCSTSKGNILSKGKFKGYAFGFIVDDIVSSI